MRTHWTTAGGPIYAFQISPLLLFCIPPSRPGALTASPPEEASVELLVPDLERFCVPDCDVPRIAEAVATAWLPTACPPTECP